jgi:hypothetical protein
VEFHFLALGKLPLEYCISPGDTWKNSSYLLHVGDVLADLIDLPRGTIEEVRETTTRETVDDFFTSLFVDEIRSDTKLRLNQRSYLEPTIESSTTDGSDVRRDAREV